MSMPIPLQTFLRNEGFLDKTHYMNMLVWDFCEVAGYSFFKQSPWVTLKCALCSYQDTHRLKATNRDGFWRMSMQHVLAMEDHIERELYDR